MEKDSKYKKWLNAQIHERTYHPDTFNPNFDDNNSIFYRSLYENYFKLLSLNFDLKNQSILEVGPAKIACLCFCENYEKSYIVEPLIFEDTLDFYNSKNIEMIHEPIELCVLPKVNQSWIFNLLQHVIDPHIVIEKMKECSEIIYFFEPIDYPMDEKHIHSLNEEFFVNEFDRNSVKKYIGNSIPNFHTANCVYGKYVIKK
jgi:hypothetical protein